MKPIIKTLLVVYSLVFTVNASAQLIDIGEVDGYVNGITNPVIFCHCASSTPAMPFVSRPLSGSLSPQQAVAKCDSYENKQFALDDRSGGFSGVTSLISCGVNWYPKDRMQQMNTPPATYAPQVKRELQPGEMNEDGFYRPKAGYDRPAPQPTGSPRPWSDTPQFPYGEPKPTLPEGHEPGGR